MPPHGGPIWAEFDALTVFSGPKLSNPWTGTDPHCYLRATPAQNADVRLALTLRALRPWAVFVWAGFSLGACTPVTPPPPSRAPSPTPPPVLAASVAPTLAASEPLSPLLGRPIPDHAWPLLGGGTVRTSAQRGNVLVLDFWSTTCAPCLRAFPALNALFVEHQGAGLRVLAVSEDTDESRVPALVADKPVAFAVALDVEQSAGELFGVASLPTTFVVDRKGIVRFVHHGAKDPELRELREQVARLLAE